MKLMKDISQSYKNIRSSYILIEVVCIVFGLCLAINPILFESLISYGVAALCLIIAAVNLIIYFTNASPRKYIEPGFIFSVVLAILGIVVLIKPQIIFAVFSIVVGIIFIVSGIFKLQDALILKERNERRWKIVLVFAVVSCALGIFSLINPLGMTELFTRIVGIFFVVDGALGLFGTILVRTNKVDKNN